MVDLAMPAALASSIAVLNLELVLGSSPALFTARIIFLLNFARLAPFLISLAFSA